MYLFSSPVLQIKLSLAFTKLVDLLKSIELFLIKYRCIKSFYYINTHFKLLIEYTSQTKKHYVTIITYNKYQEILYFVSRNERNATYSKNAHRLSVKKTVAKLDKGLESQFDLFT